MQPHVPSHLRSGMSVSTLKSSQVLRLRGNMRSPARRCMQWSAVRLNQPGELSSWRTNGMYCQMQTGFSMLIAVR